jgi:hypothetical protein
MEYNKEQCRGILIGTFGIGALCISQASQYGYRIDVDWKSDNCINDYAPHEISNVIMMMPQYGKTINEAIDELILYVYGPNWQNIAAKVYLDKKNIKNTATGVLNA